MLCFYLKLLGAAAGGWPRFRFPGFASTRAFTGRTWPGTRSRATARRTRPRATARPRSAAVATSVTPMWRLGPSITGHLHSELTAIHHSTVHRIKCIFCITLVVESAIKFKRLNSMTIYQVVVGIVELSLDGTSSGARWGSFTQFSTVAIRFFLIKFPVLVNIEMLTDTLEMWEHEPPSASPIHSYWSQKILETTTSH